VAKLTPLIGFHAVTARLKRHPDSVGSIYCSSEREDARLTKLLELATAQAITVHKVPRARLDGMAPSGRHQGVVAMVSELPALVSAQDLLAHLEHPPLVLVLDGITDPHNFGACLRSADAFGADCVIVPKDGAAPLNEVVAKAASGAMESVPIVHATNLVRAIEELKAMDIWVYGAAGEAQTTLTALKPAARAAYILGAEGDGMRRLTREHCDALFHLPMQGTVESLNVSVATGIVLYQHRNFT
jgi:23S rRNA (guanosine2251-2'-O)-methyltransferase